MSNTSPHPAPSPQATATAKPATATRGGPHLTAQAQALYDEAVKGISEMPNHLFTPRAWADDAFRLAIESAGTREGAERTAELKRYLACIEMLRRLAEEYTKQLVELRDELANARAGAISAQEAKTDIERSQEQQEQ